jgi:hypothetical protein
MPFRNWGKLRFIAEELVVMLDVRDYRRVSVLLAEFVSIVSAAVRRPH